MLDSREPATLESTRLQTILSPREYDVLALTAKGLTNAEIARSLHVTVHAIKFHLASVYRKLHVANRTEATVAFLRWSPQTDGGNGKDESWT